MNFKKILKYTGILILFVLFLIQAFFFVAFELAAPAFVAEENSPWYNSFFLISIPANLYLLYLVSKR
jgi:hypothetical protein